MLYTVGNRKNYQAAVTEHGKILKKAGGYAFRTLDDAIQCIEFNNAEGVWSVWELEANWEEHTKPSSDGWHVLIEDRLIIREVSSDE